jgi:hypothetical protein
MTMNIKKILPAMALLGALTTGGVAFADHDHSQTTTSATGTGTRR